MSASGARGRSSRGSVTTPHVSGVTPDRLGRFKGTRMALQARTPWAVPIRGCRVHTGDPIGSEDVLGWAHSSGAGRGTHAWLSQVPRPKGAKGNPARPHPAPATHRQARAQVHTHPEGQSKRCACPAGKRPLTGRNSPSECRRPPHAARFRVKRQARRRGATGDTLWPHGIQVCAAPVSP